MSDAVEQVAGGGQEAVAARAGVRSRFAGRWQIPALLLGAALLAIGVQRQVASYRPVSFDEHLVRVARLREANEMSRAATYIKYLLGRTRRTADEQAELFRLYGQVAYQAEASMAAHSDANVAAIISNLERAHRGGVVFGWADWLALGEAFRWSGRWAESIEALTEALAGGAPGADGLRRKVVEMRLATQAPGDPKVVEDVSAVLASAESSPANFAWALDLTIERLLSEQKVAEAEALLQSAAKRLTGSDQLAQLRYLEALCQRSQGRAESAEALLRSLLNEWTTRDELWGRAGWLLGRLQQEDDRPQQALSFYEGVLASFVEGELKWACELGRAECLAALARFDSALEAFGLLVSHREAWERSRWVEAEAVRTALVIVGERLRKLERYEQSNGYYELALALAGRSLTGQRAHYLAQLGDNCAAMGRRGRSAGDLSAAGRWFAEAGRYQMARADIETTDGLQAEALELAAEHFDAAGRPAEMTEALARLVARHPTDGRRSAGMFKLAQAYEVQGRLDEAISTYEEIMSVYRRLPDAMRSMVPLARCLIRRGGADAARGAAMLTQIVDDLGPEPAFTPRAAEYRQALFELAEYYARLGDAATDEVTGAAAGESADASARPAGAARPGDSFEQAISRLEDALAMYPDAAEAPRLLFLLAESYRRSAAALRGTAASQVDARTRRAGLGAAGQRLGQAATAYDRLIARLAGQDASALGAVEQAYLRAAYLHRGDCLFEAGQFAAAMDVYREAQWRYEGDPAAVAAGVQIHHCLLRLGQADEARVALARLNWLLRKLPASAFDTRRGMASKAYWESLVSRLEQTAIEPSASAMR